MRLLLACPHFEPDNHAATGEVMTQLVYGLADLGYEITVVTSLPWYREHKVDPEWRGRLWRVESKPWGKVIRVWPFPTDKNNLVTRALGFVGFTGLVSAKSLFSGSYDVVMSMSPPIFMGDAGYIAAKRSKAPFVFNVQDIFPDVAVDLGALTNKRVIKLAKRYEKSLYKRADAITVLSEDQAINVRSKISDGNKVRIIHNFVNLDRYQPTDKENSYRAKHGLSGKTVVMYSGNVGLSQSFDLIREAAIEFQGRKDLVFVINGEGAARSEVDSWAKDLANVRVYDFGPREEISEILSAADLHLILLKKGLAKSSTPSKLYGILGVGRPILASVDVGSEVAQTVNKAEAGISVPPENSEEFIKALNELLESPDKLASMGDNARSFALNWLNPKAQAEAYDNLFKDLTGE